MGTTGPELRTLVGRLGETEPVLVGQEVGKMAYLVHDAVTSTGTKIVSFNAWHPKMIASSRKKTDRRDAYWIAKALQTGMTPNAGIHPDRRGPAAAGVAIAPAGTRLRAHALALRSNRQLGCRLSSRRGSLPDVRQ